MLCRKCRGMHFRAIEECPQIIQDRVSWSKPITRDHHYSPHSDGPQSLNASAAAGCHFCILLRDSFIRKGVLGSDTFGHSDASPGEIFIEIQSTRYNWGSAPPTQQGSILYIVAHYGHKRVGVNCVEKYADPIVNWLEAKASVVRPYENVVPSSERSVQVSSYEKCQTKEDNLSAKSHWLRTPVVPFLSGSRAINPSRENHHTDNREVSNVNPSRVLDHATISEPNLVLASIWLRHCLKNHSSVCASFQSDFGGPARLINVRFRDRPFLEVVKQNRVPYVALSYKWGDSKRYLSQLDNFEDHCHGIPIRALPRTFTDAIDTTRGIGLTHLWIDALCIIQDSPDDMAREIGRMDDIFRGSTLSIFAQAADHADSGISVPRNPQDIQPCKLSVKISAFNDSLFISTYAYYPARVDPRSPLKERGWVLQEELLAPRALNFGARQMEWQCLCSTFTEDNPGLNTTWSASNAQTPVSKHYHGRSELWLRDYPSGIRLSMRDFAKSTYFEEGTFQDVWATLVAWYQLIEDYTERSLTYVEDVLPALAGVARSISRFQKLKYLNGLWGRDLDRGLLWYAAYVQQDHGSVHAVEIGSPEHSVADSPSWTWVSRWGTPIKFWKEQPLSENRVLVMADEPLDSRGYRQPGANDYAVLVYQKITTKTLVVDGYITTGRVGGSSIPREKAPWPSSDWSRDLLDLQSEFVTGHINFDFDPGTNCIDEITYLACAAALPEHAQETAMLISLALVPTDRPKEYTRIGLVVMYWPAWRAHAESVNGYFTHLHHSNVGLLHRWDNGFRYTTITLV